MVKNKYEKLMTRKKGMYTADNRPIEIYKKGKEKILIAFSPNGEMEIIGHNPIPFLAGLALRSAPAIVGAAKSFISKDKKADRATIIPKPYHKSLTNEIIEAEVYGDRNFN